MGCEVHAIEKAIGPLFVDRVTFKVGHGNVETLYYLQEYILRFFYTCM